MSNLGKHRKAICRDFFQNIFLHLGQILTNLYSLTRECAGKNTVPY